MNSGDMSRVIRCPTVEPRDSTGLPISFRRSRSAARVPPDKFRRRCACQPTCSSLVPHGRRLGSEWIARNPTRADRHLGSFKINLRTGRWADFATGDAGGDLIHFEPTWTASVRVKRRAASRGSSLMKAQLDDTRNCSSRPMRSQRCCRSSSCEASVSRPFPTHMHRGSRQAIQSSLPHVRRSLAPTPDPRRSYKSANEDGRHAVGQAARGHGTILYGLHSLNGDRSFWSRGKRCADVVAPRPCCARTAWRRQLQARAR